MQIIDDESREFFTSQMVRLELLPNPRFTQPGISRHGATERPAFNE